MTTKLANILHCYAMEQLQAMPASRIQEMFGDSGERERTPSQRQMELEALLPDIRQDSNVRV